MAYWSLRVGAALCFIGHGAFGFITKEAWLSYFAVAGIPEAWAWQLMPFIGGVDVMVGMSVLFAPRALPLIYMVAWASWTALLRPLAGESFFETLERAGNYGVPLALLFLSGFPRTVADLLRPVNEPDPDTAGPVRARFILKWTTCALLVGHAALGISGKAMLVAHYDSVGLPASTPMSIGVFELLLAATIAVKPMVSVLFFTAAWKLATELLFISAGAPIWEVVERAGSYAAPLALAALLSMSSSVAESGHSKVRRAELAQE
jgi:hypothetical protein